MTKSDWASRFALKRRAIDRAILAECERQIAQEAQDGPRGHEAINPSPDPESPAEAIARAFGRPVQ
jgi:hypothetical protein